MLRQATVPVLFALAAHAGAALAQELPPPGLYRVDTVAQADDQVGPHQAIITTEEDGASGDQATRSVVAGMDSGRTVHKGGAPVTQCVKAGPPPLPPAFGKGTCTNQETRRSAQGVVLVESCQTGKFTLTIRRLDAKTWEYVSEHDMSTGTTPTLDGTRRVLEMAAQSAESPEDRARAANALADLPRREAQMKRDRAKAEAALRQALAKARTPEEAAAARKAIERLHGKVPVKISDRTTLTRIADRCTSP
jgi:hypothetical protein